MSIFGLLRVSILLSPSKLSSGTLILDSPHLCSPGFLCYKFLFNLLYNLEIKQWRRERISPFQTVLIWKFTATRPPKRTLLLVPFKHGYIVFNYQISQIFQHRIHPFFINRIICFLKIYRALLTLSVMFQHSL